MHIAPLSFVFVRLANFIYCLSRQQQLLMHFSGGYETWIQTDFPFKPNSVYATEATASQSSLVPQKLSYFSHAYLFHIDVLYSKKGGLFHSWDTC